MYQSGCMISTVWNGKLSWAQILDFVIIIFEGFAVKTTDFGQKNLKIEICSSTCKTKYYQNVFSTDESWLVTYFH